MPSRPHGRLEASRMERSIQAVVVFPFVPVIPAILSLDVGFPLTALQMRAYAARTSGTTHCGVETCGRGRSVRTAEQPLATASAAKSRPSNFVPRMAANTESSVASRLSSVASLTITSPQPTKLASGKSRRRLTGLGRSGSDSGIPSDLPVR